MSWRILLYLITCQQILFAIPIIIINNSIFDSNYRLANISNITSQSLCICQCCETSNCISANYYGQRRECILFSAVPKYQQLHVVPINENTSVISLKNITLDAVTTSSSNIITTTISNRANLSCNISTSAALSYTTLPTSYQKQTYNYTALSNGTAILEFGFKARNPAKTWHLDDVSILDRTASNIEMLVNGNFENGSLNGWEVVCSSVNCGGTGGVLVQSSCHIGSYCFEGTCQDAYDFLSQAFTITSGHVYMLSFWLYTDGHSAQAAYVTIRE